MLKCLKFIEMSRNSESKFQVHLSSTKAMFQYMTVEFISHKKLNAALLVSHAGIIFTILSGINYVNDSGIKGNV